MTRLELSRGDRQGALALGAVAGAVLGVVVELAWSWLDDRDWLPWRPVAEFVMSGDGIIATVARPAGLAVIGIVLMAIWAADQPRLIISDSEIEVEHRKQRRVIRRDQVAGIYLEGAKVLIDSPEGRRLFDREIEGAKKNAADAFLAHGYPWESRRN